ncbi:DUF4296 domain-containing protein [Bacteroidota bacterium]
MRKILLISLVLLGILACHRDKPGKNILPAEDMVPVLIDMHMSYAIQTEPNIREISRKVDSIDSHSYIFNKHNVAKADFDSSISWYSRHPKQFTAIYDEVVMKLTRLNDSLYPNRE